MQDASLEGERKAYSEAKQATYEPSVETRITLPQRDLTSRGFEGFGGTTGYVLVLVGSCVTCLKEPFTPSELGRSSLPVVAYVDGLPEEVARHAAAYPPSARVVAAQGTPVFRALKDSWAPRAFRVDRDGRILESQPRGEGLVHFLERVR